MDRFDHGVVGISDNSVEIDCSCRFHHNRIVLNFSKLGFTNHTWGIFQLIFTANSLVKEAGGRLAVCGMKGHVRRVYTFASLGKFAPGYRRESQAVEALASQPDTY